MRCTPQSLLVYQCTPYKTVAGTWEKTGCALASAMDVSQVAARGLIIQKSKTSNRVAMEITGELAALLERVAKRKREKCPNGREKVYSTRLIVDDDGLALGRAALRYRFDKAREAAGTAKGEFQFRDIRAKAGTDKADSAKDIREAQHQLGHSSVTTTEIYVRKKWGQGHSDAVKCGAVWILRSA